MKGNIRLRFLLTLLIVVASGFGEDIQLNVGDSAPDFTLSDQDSIFHRLHDYRGKNVVVYFFPKAHTPG